MDFSYSRLACLVSDLTLFLILQNSCWYFLSLVSMYLVHSLCFCFMSLTVLFSSGVDLLELSARGLCGLTGVYFVSAVCIASFSLFHFSSTVESDEVSLFRFFSLSLALIRSLPYCSTFLVRGSLRVLQLL